MVSGISGNPSALLPKGRTLFGRASAMPFREACGYPARKSKWRPALLWAPASIAVLMCLLLFTGKTKLPAPDFAVGADQNLLVEVEQALYRDCPEALAPAATLVQEIR